MQLPTHPGTQVIETGRLRLRRFRPEDAPTAFANWTNSAEVCRHLQWAPHGTVQATHDVLERWIARYDNPACYHWCIALRGSDEAIGALEFVALSEHNRWAEAGYCLGRAWWGQGIMTEALRAVVDFAFTRTPLHRIEARHSVKNPASGRVMEKAGMTYEGTARGRSLVHGDFVDTAQWAILREDWEAAYPAAKEN